MSTRGVITPRFTVWCGCGQWEPDATGSTRKLAAGAARAAGWAWSRGPGWRCPRCLSASTEIDEGARLTHRLLIVTTARPMEQAACRALGADNLTANPHEVTCPTCKEWKGAAA